MSATVPSAACATDAVSYDDLYARWERGNWRATEIDFSQDVVDWNEKLTPEQRRSALWLYTLFIHGGWRAARSLAAALRWVAGTEGGGEPPTSRRG